MWCGGVLEKSVADKRCRVGEDCCEKGFGEESYRDVFLRSVGENCLRESVGERYCRAMMDKGVPEQC